MYVKFNNYESSGHSAILITGLLISLRFTQYKTIYLQKIFCFVNVLILPICNKNIVRYFFFFDKSYKNCYWTTIFSRAITLLNDMNLFLVFLIRSVLRPRACKH